jgi:hypothetical protein
MYDEVDRYSDDECEQVFMQLFPHGPTGQDVLREIAPQGWEHSSLLAVFHPSLHQVYDEAVRLHRNLQSLPWRGTQQPPRPEPTRDAVAQTYGQTPIDTEVEVRELVGDCLWDIFSDNHEVMASDGRIVDIGSFRGAGGFIADWLNRHTGTHTYDYMDFYMGTIWIAQRADLTPVYAMIFRRLKAHGYDWRYAFPELGLVDMRPLRDALDEHTANTGDMRPISVPDEDEAEKQRASELAEVRASLDRAHREAVDTARHGPPPTTVEAYSSVYGCWPEGWPPVVEQPG